MDTRSPSSTSSSPSSTSTDQLLSRIADLERENVQLRAALASRIVIEQAKGVLAERHLLVPDQAFEALRRAARSHGRRIHELAREVVFSSQTPAAVVREIQQPSRQ
jgi:AmiR/NasT family two-component response regulator